ncbi:MAG: copper resistance protein CopC, partial [Dehalococcoidia bacterium]|nr:copper resistance protein CopC [Dehalococcoidia bacterium]
MKPVLTIVLACVLALVVQSQVAEAHANLVRSEPAANSTLDASPDRITIWFTEPMEAGFSEIQVLNSSGARVDGENSAVDANDLTVMSVGLPSLPDGTYTVAWRNLSTIDGHSLRGSFIFSVGEPISEASAAQTSETPTLWSPVEPYIRWIALLSALALTGALVFDLLVSAPVLTAAGTRTPLGRLRPRLRARSQRLLWVALITFLAASVAQLLTQVVAVFDIPLIEAAGTPAIELLQETDWGGMWQYRVGLGVLVGVLFLLPLIVRFRRAPNRERLVSVLLWLALIASLGILATISMTSHAAATIGIARYALVNDVVHLTAAAVWVGGLMQLIANTPLFIHGISENARRNALWRLVRRFSVAAGLSVVVLIATGVYSAWAQVTDFVALDTPYGGALMAKLLAFAVLLVVAAVNLIWVRPRLRGSSTAARWLRRTVVAEIGLAVLVIFVVGFLTALEPARQVASRALAIQQQGLSFTDTVDGTDILLIVEPGQVGANSFTVSLADRFGNPIDDATDLRLRVSYLDADFGEESVPTVNIGGGEYELSDATIGIAGAYQAEILVQRPDAFDARTAFRFEVGSAGVDGGSAAIAPDAARGGLYLGIVLGVLGVLFLGAGIPMGGWYNRAGALTMACGAAGFIAGAWLLIGAQSASDAQAIVRNPIAPTSE